MNRMQEPRTQDTTEADPFRIAIARMNARERQMKAEAIAALALIIPATFIVMWWMP
jgi:hypothetical protein